MLEKLSAIASEIETGAGVLLVVECHGSEEGLALTEEFVPWVEIRAAILSINRKSAMGLVVIFSSCHGIYFFEQVTVYDVCPFYRIFGPREGITVGQLEAANQTVLLKLIAGSSVDEAASEANIPLAVHGLEYVDLQAEQAFKKAFLQYMDVLCNPIEMIGRLVHHGAEFQEIENRFGRPVTQSEAHFVQLVLDKGNLEAAYNKYRDQFLLTNDHPDLHSRFMLNFETIFEESRLAQTYPGIDR